MRDLTPGDVSRLMLRDAADDPSVTPPTMNDGSDFTLMSFEATRAGSTRALATCFSTPLRHGFSTEEIAPLVLDTLRDIAVRKLELKGVQNGLIVTRENAVRREDTVEASSAVDLRSTDHRGVIVSELSFTASSELVACVSACTDQTFCGETTRAKRFLGPTMAPPEPGALLSVLLAAVRHPEHTLAGGVALTLLASVLLVRFRRRPKSRAGDRKARRFFV